MTIAAINGSPRGESASSREVITLLERLGGAPVLLITAPLYIDGLPATTVRALERYRDSLLRLPEREHPARTGGQRVFAVINCGFYEGSQNRHALEMIEHFCREAGLTWCGGIGIGTGEMIRGLRDVPLQAGIRRPVVTALRALVEAMGDSDGRLEENLYPQHRLPWWAYRLLGQMGWRRQARQNGLRSAAVHNRPHAVA